MGRHKLEDDVKSLVLRPWFREVLIDGERPVDLEERFIETPHWIWARYPNVRALVSGKVTVIPKYLVKVLRPEILEGQAFNARLRYRDDCPKDCVNPWHAEVAVAGGGASNLSAIKSANPDVDYRAQLVSPGRTVGHLADDAYLTVTMRRSILEEVMDLGNGILLREGEFWDNYCFADDRVAVTVERMLMDRVPRAEVEKRYEAEDEALRKAAIRIDIDLVEFAYEEPKPRVKPRPRRVGRHESR